MRRALKRNPGNSDAHLNRGLALLYLRDWHGLSASLTDAIRLEPRMAKAYVYRGNAFMELGSFDKARADYDKAIQVDPANAEAYSVRGILREQSNLQAGIDDFNMAISIDPGGPLFYKNRAAAYEALGDTACATADRKKMAELIALGKAGKTIEAAATGGSGSDLQH